jgi:hypothetical protein
MKKEGQYAAVPLLPTVKRLLGDTHLADNLHHRRTKLRLAQSKSDLFLGKLALFHGKTSFLAL